MLSPTPWPRKTHFMLANRHRTQITKMSNSNLLGNARHLHTESWSELGAKGEGVPPERAKMWMLGESVGFHPVEKLTDYLSLVDEILRRRTRGIRSMVRTEEWTSWKEMSRRFPPCESKRSG